MPRSGTRKRPTSSLVAVRVRFVPVFLTCIVAPPIAAPDGSITVPEIAAVAWACSPVGLATTVNRTTATANTENRLWIFTLVNIPPPFPERRIDCQEIVTVGILRLDGGRLSKNALG